MPDFFYPPLSTLIPFEKVPESVGPFKDGLENAFSHLFFKDLQVSGSAHGEGVQYDFHLITKTRLAIEFFGTDGIGLVLNPAYDPTADPPVLIAEFPISFFFRWEILKHYDQFDFQNFDWSARSFFDLILNVTAVSEDQLFLAAIISVNPDEDADSIDLFISDFNANYNPTNPLVRFHPPQSHPELLGGL